MKTLNTQLILLVAALGVGVVGCSKSGGGFDAGVPVVSTSGVDSTNVLPTLPDSTIDTGTGSTSTTPSFTPVSLAEMNAYVGSYPLNNPTNYQLSINLNNWDGQGHYAGSVTLSYDDNGYHHAGTFTSNTGYNTDYESYGTALDVGTNSSAYNTWFNLNGKTVFSGYFQDQYGAIILIVDNASTVNQGDGQGGGYISGQVWYRNFAASYAYQSNLRQCWFIYSGPYDCRSNIVNTKTGLYPTDSYRKLGEFKGILKSSAFPN